MLLRLTLYSTLGLVLDALGQGFNSWGFWCVLALFISAEHLTRIQVVEDINAEVERIKAERKAKDNSNDTQP